MFRSRRLAEVCSYARAAFSDLPSR